MVTQDEFEAAWKERQNLQFKITEARNNLRKWEARERELDKFCQDAIKAQNDA